MIQTFVLAYLGGWVITTLATFGVGRWLADGPTTLASSLGFSLLAGLVWPLMVVGVVELSSVAVYSTATSRRHDSEIPESWLTVGSFDHVVAPLR